MLTGAHEPKVGKSFIPLIRKGRICKTKRQQQQQQQQQLQQQQQQQPNSSRLINQIAFGHDIRNNNDDLLLPTDLHLFSRIFVV